jgi:transcriptional regulator with XRE-family HTH domain
MVSEVFSLAKELGYSQQERSHIENRHHSPLSQLFKATALFYGVSMDVFFEQG